MNISGSNLSSNHSEGLRNGYVHHAGRVNGSEVAAVEGKHTTPASGDRVEISDAARTAANDAPARELALARKALNAVPELSSERISEIKSRIQDGYYTNPEVLRHVAAQIANDLAGSSF